MPKYVQVTYLLPVNVPRRLEEIATLMPEDSPYQDVNALVEAYLWMGILRNLVPNGDKESIDEILPVDTALQPTED